MVRASETARLIRDAAFPRARLLVDASLREGAPAVPEPNWWRPAPEDVARDGARLEAAFRAWFHRDVAERQDTHAHDAAATAAAAAPAAPAAAAPSTAAAAAAAAADADADDAMLGAGAPSEAHESDITDSSSSSSSSSEERCGSGGAAGGALRAARANNANNANSGGVAPPLADGPAPSIAPPAGAGAAAAPGLRARAEVLVCHGNVIRFFALRALQLPPEAWLRMAVAHASITTITITAEGDVLLSALGDAGHLDAKDVTFS
jgi:hypothetical protein